MDGDSIRLLSGLRPLGHDHILNTSFAPGMFFQ